MRGFNQVTLVGNCGKDPELKSLADGTHVAKLTLATTINYRLKDGTTKSNTDWHVIILWRGLAELANKHVKKGSLLLIKGQLRNRNYDHELGHKVYVTEIIADEMLLLDKKITVADSPDSEDDQILPF